MISVFNEIMTLRNQEPLVIDNRNSNRYRIVANEANGSKTAYYFSVPIFNIRTKQSIDLRFHKEGEVIYSTGSNSTITITDTIQLNNAYGNCNITVPKKVRYHSERELYYGNDRIYPTSNGIAFVSYCDKSNPFSILIETGPSRFKVRSNDKCFCLMRKKFEPFITFACIGRVDSKRNIIEPAKIDYDTVDENRYQLFFSSYSGVSGYIVIEVNLYESKIVQDTTVESNHPKVNNAYGSISFLGNTEAYGEQWIYKRLDYSKLSDLSEHTINKAILHTPKFNENIIEYCALRLSSRFCSFGSTWNKKTTADQTLLHSVVNNNYINTDLLLAISDTQGHLIPFEGVILKPTQKDEGNMTISTGDCYLKPEILEINYV